MLYSVLIYDSEPLVEKLTAEENASQVARHVAFQQQARGQGILGPVARLLPTTAAVTLKLDESSEETRARRADGAATKLLLLDGPFAETKEQLVGFYIIQCESLEQAIEHAKTLPIVSGGLEVRPIGWFDPGALPNSLPD